MSAEDDEGCSYGLGYGLIAWLCLRPRRTLNDPLPDPYVDLEDCGRVGEMGRWWWLELGREELE